MKELKKLSKNLFISLKKLNRFLRYQRFLYFYDFAESAKSKSIYDITYWLEKLAIHIFTYNSRTIIGILKFFHT